VPKYLRHLEKVATKTSKRAFRVGWFLWTLAVVAGTHWPSLQLPSPPENSIWDLFPIDKIGHACGFTGLVIWTCLAWCTRSKPTDPLGYLKTVLVLIPCALFAVVSEHTQQLVGGRSFDQADILANLTGALAGFLIIAPRPHESRITTISAWIARLGVLGLCFPLYQLWGTAAGGADAMKAYDILGFSSDRPDHEAHTWLAFALTLTISVARPLGIKRPRTSAAFTILGIAFLGPFMEIVQLNAGRKGMDLSDIAAHEKGLMLGLAAWVGLLTLRWAITLYASIWRGGTPTDHSTSPPTAAIQPTADRGFVGHAALVSALTLLSRLTGLVRDAALAAVFGLGWVADAFFVAFLIPNLFRRLFGEGALTAAFIPRYTKLRESDPELARRFATCCVSGLAVLLIALTLVGEAFFLVLLTGADTERNSTTLRLALTMLPYMPMICGVAFLGAVLQVHGRFGPAAGAPVLLNLVLVAAAALTGPWTLQDNQPFADPQRISAAVTIAWAILAAGVLQLAWQLIALLKTTRPAFSTKGVAAPIKQMLTTMLPMLVGLGIFQINALLDSLIAYFGSPPPPPPEVASSGAEAVIATGAFGIQGLAFPLQTGDVAALQWAQRLYQFPLGVFGIAIATAIFPALARAAKDKTDFGKITRQGLRLTVFIGLPSTVGMVLVALPLTRAVYERAAFSLADAQHVSTILIGYAAAVWAYSMTHTLTRAFYALDDAKTPLRVSLVMVAVNLALNLTLIWPFGAAGLAWSSAICAVAQACTLAWLLSRKPEVDRVVDDTVLNGWLRTLGLTAVMAVVLAPCLRFVDVSSLSTWQNAGVLGGTTLLGAIIFFGGAWLTKADELAWLRKSRS